MDDISLLVRDKYNGDASLVTQEDRGRLAAGEPLAYVIGWIPFLGLRIELASKPLIPRPETEWWTEKLIARLKEQYGHESFRFLDLCAGSGAIGLAVLKAFPNACVWFGELMPEHCEQIRRNITVNGLDESGADVRESHLFEAFRGDVGQMMPFNVIATNPPYIPSDRTLDISVVAHEPQEALFAGPDGMDIIRKVVVSAQDYLYPKGEMWMECDIDNSGAARDLCIATGAKDAVILNDLYDRPRVVVSYYP